MYKESAVKMGKHGVGFIKVEKRLNGFTSALTSAACEWLLIFLLLIDAVLSYTLTRFASYCLLPLPCILCSRLDHILGNEKPKFYLSLLCSKHRSELSTLVSCHIHDKLADGHSMCEDCFLSITTKSEPNLGMNRLLMGKFGSDSDGSSGTRICDCCNETRRLKQSAKRRYPLKSAEVGISKPGIPLPRRVSRRDSLKRMKRKFSGSGTYRQLGENNFGSISHVGYRELKRTSNSEPEVSFSEDGDGGGRKYSEISESKMTHNSSYPHMHTDPCKSDDMKNYDVSSEDNRKAYPASVPELISLDDISPFSNAAENHVGVSIDKSADRCVISELMSLIDSTSYMNIEKVPVEASARQSADVSETSDTRDISIDKHAVVLKSVITTTEAGISADEDVNETLSIHPTRVDQNDKLNEKDPEITLEKSAIKDGDRVNEMINDASSSTMKRADSLGPESVDGSVVSDIEGESIVDKLKRQVEYDRKSINSLYKELEEERNASTIAANQAMAMITRLQAEKASLNMEALQYLRMMEEQAEYDVEALEKANDLLAEKEKELQDLEAELEYFRLRVPDETTIIQNVNDDVSVDNDELVTGVQTAWSELENEKSYIANSLKNLEMRLHQLNHRKPLNHTVNRGNDGEEISNDTEFRINGGEDIYAVDIENEISDLHERLEALEADCNLIEHSINALRDGNEGVKYVRDIARQLQELRKIEIQSKCQCVVSSR